MEVGAGGEVGRERDKSPAGSVNRAIVSSVASSVGAAAKYLLRGDAGNKLREARTESDADWDMADTVRDYISFGVHFKLLFRGGRSCDNLGRNKTGNLGLWINSAVLIFMQLYIGYT